MTLKRLLGIFVFIFCLSGASVAQDYNTGIGVRGGFYNGLTIKHFVGQKAAIEGLLSSRWRGFKVTGLYEIHNNAFGVDRLNWYYGPGAHIGFYDGRYPKWAKEDRNYTVIGVDFILGIEYNFTEIPINLGADWKPAFDLIGYNGFFYDGGAISLRYIF